MQDKIVYINIAYSSKLSRKGFILLAAKFQVPTLQSATLMIPSRNCEISGGCLFICFL